jgi:hypothetical protein
MGVVAIQWACSGGGNVTAGNWTNGVWGNWSYCPQVRRLVVGAVGGWGVLWLGRLAVGVSRMCVGLWPVCEEGVARVCAGRAG